MLLMGMKSFKATSPYGFYPFFFKHFWSYVGDSLWKPVRDALSLGPLILI